MKQDKPLIFISNDDGVYAAGLYRLIDFLSPFGRIIAAAPDAPRSGQSMAITVNEPLRITFHKEYNGAKVYSVNGTPTDCVKLAMHTLLDERPAMVASGINHGSNAAVNVVYSGTMGATFEGCAFGVPSVGFSLTDHSPDADFTHCRPFVEKITRAVLEHGLPAGVCLNVNMPKAVVSPEAMKVVRACRGKWTDEYEEYTDPHGRKFYWLKGKFENEEPEATDTDEWCLAHGIVSVVPTLLDRTAPVVPTALVGFVKKG